MRIYAALEPSLSPRPDHAPAHRARLATALLICAAMLLSVNSVDAQTREAADSVDWETAKNTDPAEWSDELKAQIEAAGHDIEAIATRVRAHLADKAGERGGEDKARAKRIWEAAFQTAPDEWSDRLKNALLEINPGSTIDEVAEKVRRRQRELRVWNAAMATDPDEWSDGLKAAILELRPDNTIEEIAAGIRKRQAHAHEKQDEAERLDAFKKGVIERAMATDPNEWSDRLKAAITRAGWDLEEFTEGVRQRQAHRDAKSGGEPADKSEPSLEDFGRRIRAAVESGSMTPEEGRRKMAEYRLHTFKRGVIERAMAAPPEEWSDRLKAAITRSGWDLAEFTEGVRRRQAAAAEGRELNTAEFNSLFQLNTSIENITWGQIKEESSQGQ